MTETGSVEDGLRAWANGSYPLEAAVELLIRTGWTRRGDFYDDAIEGTGQPGRWWIDFDRVGAALRGERDAPWLAASGGELRIMRIANSLAGNGLNDTIPGLDRRNMALVLAALSHANGSHEHSRIVPDPDGPHVDENTGTRLGIERLGPLYPWPDGD